MPKFWEVAGTTKHFLKCPCIRVQSLTPAHTFSLEKSAVYWKWKDMRESPRSRDFSHIDRKCVQGMWHVLVRESLKFDSCITWFLDLDGLVRINRAWLYKDLKVPDLQANASLAQLVRHWTLKPVTISCIRSNPIAVVKSFDVNAAISANSIGNGHQFYCKFTFAIMH